MEQLQKIAKAEVDKKRAFHHVDDDVPDFFPSSSSSFSGISSESSSESNSFEEVTSHSSSSPPPPSNHLLVDPLSDMSSLIQQLPIKRGLSKHYEGKSQSFTSLANVRSLEDLAKSENPYSKKLKYYRSYEERLVMTEIKKVKCGPNALSRPISKKGTLKSSNSKKSYSFTTKRINPNGFLNNMPPKPPQRSTNTAAYISDQTPLFA